MTGTLRQRITDTTGVSDQAGLDALAAIIDGERHGERVEQMEPARLRELIHTAVGIWADRGWPRILVAAKAV